MVRSKESIDNYNKKHHSNVGFITYLMNYNHPIIQAMIMQAIKEFTDKIIDNKEELIKEELELIANRKIPLVSYELWIDLAETIQYAIKTRKS